MGFRESKTRAFTFIELMIAVLILSSILVATSNYFKSNTTSLSVSTVTEEVRSTYLRVRSKLDADLKQAVALNPACDTNAPAAFFSGSCGSLKVLGGITPLPNVYKADVHAMTTFGAPSNISDAVGTFTKHSDGIRILQYDFTGSFNCQLNPRHTATANPSTTSERFWAHPQCSGNLSVGKLYVMVDEIDDDGVAYSNVFQITGLTNQTLSDGTIDIQVDISSSNNYWNQSTYLGNAGFGRYSRIYPVKMVEYAVDPTTSGLWRREIIPSSSDMQGYQSWTQVEPAVESLQFAYTLGNSTSTAAHSRSIVYTANTWDNGLEDILGVTPHLVLKSEKPTLDASKTYDNPLTSTVEADKFPRKEVYFYVAMRNR